MRDPNLFKLHREELIDRAKKARVQAPEHMTNRQMIHAIEVANTKYKLGSPYILPEHLCIDAPGDKSFITIENSTKQSMHLRLELMDRRGVFTIPTDQSQITIDAKEHARIPISFYVEPTGIVMGRSAKYQAAIRVWDVKANLIVEQISLTGRAPYYVERGQLSCLEQLSPPPVGSPSVSIYAEDAESNLPILPPIKIIDAGHRVRIRWSVYEANWFRISQSHLGLDIVPPHEEEGNTFTTFTDSFTTDGPTVETLGLRDQIEDSFETTIYRSTTFSLFAQDIESDPSGPLSADDSVSIHVKIPIGYHRAWTSAPVREDDLERIRGYLEQIEQALREGFIRNCDRLSSRYADENFLGYLRPSFGDRYTEDNDLTHDMLEKMREVPIAIGRESLVAMGEERILGLGDLCECSPACIDDGCKTGFTPDDRSYVAICAVAPGPKDTIRDTANACIYEGFADDTVLMHELVHYGTRDIFSGHQEEEDVTATITECYCDHTQCD